MKKDLNEYLFDEVIKYLGRYPATKKRIREILTKKIKSKKTYQRAIIPVGVDKNKLIEDLVYKLDELKIINEDRYLDSMFNYYEQSLFSIKKIKNKLYQKGFDQKNIDEYVSIKLYENPDFELDILRKYVKRKKLSSLEISNLKRKLYQQSFSEGSIYKFIRD
tara:strand:- start:836 stop:1324 length:489 start_codon:yes stop_codon:yes gene_type:complete